MNFSLLRQLCPLLAAATMVLLLAGCGDSHAPTAAVQTTDDGLPLADGGSNGGSNGEEGDKTSTIAPGEPNPATPVASIEALVEQVAELGVEATYQGQSLEQSFFFPAAHIITINGQDVRVFSYATTDALQQDAAQVSADGTTLGTTSVRWIAPPRFFARSTFLALYVGADADIIGALESIFGKPFAGEGAQTAIIIDSPYVLADIRGAIAQVETSPEASSTGVLVRLLIQGTVGTDTVYDVAWVEIVAATEISFDGETLAPPTLADLTPGRQVQVSFVGPVRESYPVQAIAGQVLIFR
ncbi:MAG: hypothetical protein O2782_04925 [bacterium]|nr:hypothetical protein [bacterium]